MATERREAGDILGCIFRVGRTGALVTMTTTGNRRAVVSGT
jgi:hypothetical protein